MRTVLSGLLFALLSACVTAQGPDSGPDLGKGDDKGGGDAANALTILPIIVDQATRDWAASEPSAIDGEPFHEGRRFREGFARLLGALDDQGAPAAMLAVMFPEDAGEATALLTKTLDAYGAPVVLSDGEGRDPGLYRDRLVGHDMSRVRLIAEPEGEGVRVTAKGFGVPVDREGFSPSLPWPMPLTSSASAMTPTTPARLLAPPPTARPRPCPAASRSMAPRRCPATFSMPW